MPKDVGYINEYLNEYEKQSRALRSKKIRHQVKKQLGLVKTKPAGKRFRKFFGSTIRFG